MNKRTRLALIVLTAILAACTAQAAPALTELTALPPTATAAAPTQPSATAHPTAVPTVTPAPLSPDAQALKDIVFSDCIPLAQSFPDDMELSWNLLVKQDFSVFVFDPLEDTSVKVPRFDEETSEGYYKFFTEIFISPDGKWVAYSNNENTKAFIEPAESLIDNTDKDRIIIEKNHWFDIRGWVDNDTLFVEYPAQEGNEFYPTVFLNPFTGAEYEFVLEEMPDYLHTLMTGLITSHYRYKGNLAPDPTRRKLVYPAIGDDYKIFNMLWDIGNNRALAQIDFMIGVKNDPLWSQDGADVLLLGPNQERGLEWFLISANGVVKQITFFSDGFQEPNYWLTGASRSWDGQYLAFEILYLIDEPEEDMKFIVLDKTNILEGYCIPMTVLSWGLDSPRWSPDSKYLIVSDTDENSGYGEIFLIDNENKVRYKIGENMKVIGWIEKP